MRKLVDLVVLAGVVDVEGAPAALDDLEVLAIARISGSVEVVALVRPRDDRWIAGVCAGLARRFGLSSGMVRLIFVVSCLLPGPQFLIYLVLWALMPSE